VSRGNQEELKRELKMVAERLSVKRVIRQMIGSEQVKV
jgi:hypothetical protein